MNIFDYMNLVSGYIINTIENKRDMANNIEFKITPLLENNILYYEVYEQINTKTSFYIKFPCENKKDFYETLNALLIEYFKNSNMFCCGVMKNNQLADKSLSVVSQNRVKVVLGIHDNLDALMFMKFKRYLDEGKNIDETILEDENYEEEQMDCNIQTFSKILL